MLKIFNCNKAKISFCCMKDKRSVILLHTTNKFWIPAKNILDAIPGNLKWMSFIIYILYIYIYIFHIYIYGYHYFTTSLQLWFWRLLTKSMVACASSINRYLSRIWRGSYAMLQCNSSATYSPWYPNLKKKIKSKWQTKQNKCDRFFCVHLDSRSAIWIKEVEQIKG